MRKSQLAAQLYTIRDFTQTTDDFAESMKKIKAIGYEAVQVSAIGDIPHADVHTITSDLGLFVCITHVSYDRLINDLDDVIEQHHLWGTKHVGIGSMPMEFRNDGEDGFKRFAESANQIGEKLHAADLTFNYHNHSFEFVKFGNRIGMDILFEETDPRYLKALIDTYWIHHGGGDPVAWIKRMENRMPVVHLKDMVMVYRNPDNFGEGVTHQFAEVGEGNMNWTPILEACENIGVEYYAVEQDICPADPFDSLAISFNNLLKMGFE